MRWPWRKKSEEPEAPRCVGGYNYAGTVECPAFRSPFCYDGRCRAHCNSSLLCRCEARREKVGEVVER